MKKNGYTLAETLITLGIIGIISALLLPAVKNMRPDERKISYLKVHDAVVTAVKELASDSRLYPPCQNIMMQQQQGQPQQVGGFKCFHNHTLFNNAMKNGTDNAKFCILMAEKFGESESESNCSKNYAAFNNANRSFSFTAKTGEQFYITTNRIYNRADSDPFWLSQIVFDINGDKAPNCMYSENCPKPDTFDLAVTADGNVTPQDRAGTFYLQNRNNPKSSSNNLSGVTVPIVYDDQTQFSFDTLNTPSQ